MNEFLTYEYAVELDKKTKKRRNKRIAFLAAYIVLAILFAALLFTVGKLFLPLFALVPLLMWIAVFFTWRYTAPEYEYSITSGELTYAVIYGNRTRKRVLEQTVKKMDMIAPLTDMYRDKIKDYKPVKSYEGVSSFESPDVYFALFENDDGERCVYYFEATARALQVLRHYNPRTVVTKVRY